MSKLAEALAWQKTGYVKPLRYPIVKVKHSLSPRPAEQAEEYRLEATFSVSMLVSDAELFRAREPEALIMHVMQSAQHQVIEEAFGEFRAPLMELERALWNHDLDTAIDVLRELRTQMFSTASGERSPQ